MPPMPMLKMFTRLHVLVYRRFGGSIAKSINGLPVMLLTTTGRRSGVARTIPVTYLQSESDYIIMPGVVERPGWYFNLKSNPRAIIQIGRERINVEAETAAPERRRELWAMVPTYWKSYQKQFTRELPMMILHPIDPTAKSKVV